MALKASSMTLRKGLDSILEVCWQQKGMADRVATDLLANINAEYALNYADNFARVVPMLDAWTALPGMPEYAQAQMGSDVVADYTATRAALVAAQNWLKANIPANAITVTNAVRAYAVYTPAQTAGLRTLVQAISATVT